MLRKVYGTRSFPLIGARRACQKGSRPSERDGHSLTAVASVVNLGLRGFGGRDRHLMWRP